MAVNEAGNYTKPTMRKNLFNRIKASSKGGRPGQWSARKAQMLVRSGAHEVVNLLLKGRLRLESAICQLQLWEVSQQQNTLLPLGLKEKLQKQENNLANNLKRLQQKLKDIDRK
jgi:hypothetical protein